TTHRANWSGARLTIWQQTVKRWFEFPIHIHLMTAVQALVYLRDPYDALMDQYINLGLLDDCAVIRSAARSLISDQAVKAIS
ncbi:MAG: hypothetical protein ACRD9W_00160, partial [Terriglobia bacterium]